MSVGTQTSVKATPSCTIGVWLVHVRDLTPGVHFSCSFFQFKNEVFMLAWLLELNIRGNSITFTGGLATLFIVFECLAVV